MHASVTSFQIKNDQVDEAIKVYRDEVIPLRQTAKDSQGEVYFPCGGYLLVDRNTGKGIAITLWPSREEVTRGEKSHYYEEPKSKFKSYFASHHVDLGIYEVCTQG
ncbi:hypothetical protein ACFLVP_01035 [Chloroflexota bacterium]